MTATQEDVLKFLTARKPLSVDVDPLRFDFFSTGHVDSLDVIRFVCDLEEHFGVDIPMDVVASREFRTAASVADIIDDLVERKKK